MKAVVITSLWHRCTSKWKKKKNLNKRLWQSAVVWATLCGGGCLKPSSFPLSLLTVWLWDVNIQKECNAEKAADAIWGNLQCYTDDCISTCFLLHCFLFCAQYWSLSNSDILLSDWELLLIITSWLSRRTETPHCFFI